MDLWYGVEDSYLRLELDDGSMLEVPASWEGVHVVVQSEPGHRTIQSVPREQLSPLDGQ